MGRGAGGSLKEEVEASALDFVCNTTRKSGAIYATLGGIGTFTAIFFRREPTPVAPTLIPDRASSSPLSNLRSFLM